MPDNIVTIEISISGDKLIFDKNKKRAKANFDTGENESDDNVRIELAIAKVFHKVLNLLKTDSELFQKQDFELLGEMLAKILFGKKDDWRGMSVDETFQILNTGLFSRCRLYLSFDYASNLANLPWEYTLYKLRGDSDGNDHRTDSYYLSACRDSHFHMIRRFPDLSYDCQIREQDKLFVIQLLNVEGNAGVVPNIDSRRTEVADMVQVKTSLQTAFPDKIVWETIDGPAVNDVSARVNEIVAGWQKRYGQDINWVLHLVGHSFLDKQVGRFAMKPQQGNPPEWIDDRTVAALFNPNNLRQTPTIALLQACDSAKIGSMDGQLRGLSYEFTRTRIPAVIGMQNEITPVQSDAFCYRFYESLLNGNDVAEAVTDGRDHLGRDNRDFLKRQIQPYGESYKTNYFGSPVLFITTTTPIRMLKAAPLKTPDASAVITPVYGPGARTDLSRGIQRPIGEQAAAVTDKINSREQAPADTSAPDRKEAQWTQEPPKNSHPPKEQ